jgi:hypothetical protein
VDASLRRLKVERIDLYQMHWPAEDGTAVEDYWQVFTDLKRERKIRAAWLSNHSIGQLEAAEEIGDLRDRGSPFPRAGPGLVARRAPGPHQPRPARSRRRVMPSCGGRGRSPGR